MESTCGESSSEDEEEKNRIADIVKCLTFETDCDSPIQDAGSKQGSFVAIRKSSSKPSLRRIQEEEDEMMSLGSPQFRMNVARKLGELLDSLFGYQNKSSGHPGRKESAGKGLSVAGVKLLKSSEFIDLENNNSVRKQKIEKPPRKASLNAESSSEDEGDIELIKQATVDGWSIINDGGLVTSRPSDLKGEVERTVTEQSQKQNTNQGCNQEEEKPVKKKKKKSSVCKEVGGGKDDDKTHENPDQKSEKRKKVKSTEQKVEREQQPCRPSEESKEITENGICEDKTSQGNEMETTAVGENEEPVKKKRKNSKRTGPETADHPSGIASETAKAGGSADNMSVDVSTDHVVSENIPIPVKKKKKKKKSSVCKEIGGGKDDDKSHENPDQNSEKRKHKKVKSTEQEEESEQQPCRPSEESKEIKINGNCEDKTSQGKEDRKSKNVKEKMEVKAVGENEEPVKKKRKSSKRTGSETADHPSGIASETAKACGSADNMSVDVSTDHMVSENKKKTRKRKKNKNEQLKNV